MTAVFDYLLTVQASEIDELGHASNTVYPTWMQSAAVAHSAEQGWPPARYRELGQGWVVRSHSIEYLVPALAGDRLVVRTWVATMRKVSSVRRYQILRLPNEVLVARAETKWAFVDYCSGLPVQVPREIAQAFVVVDRSL